ncbi:hypothetical protein OXYTRIMIC_620 [Oxytricha trifallax]|uniref:Phosphoglycerate mutase family protein n=1 Tax=Oxytricha trifallax TaxID=1172189 RepID=A0A073HZB6_9SPIT|nr:hypothetical protein OXYTRIMIC_620 [Oxytricha trifallax]
MILVRHSERADDPSIPHSIKVKQDDIIIEYDAQLSRPTGKQQAIDTACTLKNKLQNPAEFGVDIDNAEIFLFSSPFLMCLETATAIAKELKCKSISVQDPLSDILMKSWYKEDPFLGLTTKLTSNKEKFVEFLKAQYNLNELTIDYKRAANLVNYPETVEATSKRFRAFYKTIVEKYFPDFIKTNERSRIVIMVTHGVPAHNPFLHMFEADKDCVFLDYSAITIVEKVGKANPYPVGQDQKDQNNGKNSGQNQKDQQQQVGDKSCDGSYMNQIGAWEIKIFGDATHLDKDRIAML